MLRVLRALPVTRRKINPVVLRSVLKTFYTAEGDRQTKDVLLTYVAPVRRGKYPIISNGALKM